MKKIIVSDKMSVDFFELLHPYKFQITDLQEEKVSLKDAIKSAECLVVRSATKVTKKLLEEAKNLELIARSGVGLDNIDLLECKDRGIKVINSAEGASVAVAEFTFGLILACARNIGFAYLKTKKGEWPKKESIGIELFGKTLGVIGTGAIGKLVVKIALAFRMKVIGYDIIHDKELVNFQNFKYQPLERLLEISDIITLHIPLLPSTKEIINQDSIRRMKKGAIIINTARGGLLNINDLLNGLNSKKICAVGLDVFASEPNIDERLRTHPAILITPHIAANSKAAQKNNAHILSKKIISYFNQS